jgi:hypothetical protein
MLQSAQRKHSVNTGQLLLSSALFQLWRSLRIAGEALTSAPAAMSSVATSDSRPLALVSTRFPPSVPAALTWHAQHYRLSLWWLITHA